MTERTDPVALDQAQKAFFQKLELRSRDYRKAFVFDRSGWATELKEIRKTVEKTLHEHSVGRHQCDRTIHTYFYVRRTCVTINEPFETILPLTHDEDPQRLKDSGWPKGKFTLPTRLISDRGEIRIATSFERPEKAEAAAFAALDERAKSYRKTFRFYQNEWPTEHKAISRIAQGILLKYAIEGHDPENLWSAYLCHSGFSVQLMKPPIDARVRTREQRELVRIQLEQASLLGLLSPLNTTGKAYVEGKHTALKAVSTQQASSLSSKDH